MANPSRAKGTKWETELLPWLRRWFGVHVDRAPLKGTQDKGDFIGVPYLHEAKAVEQPRFLEWARSCQRKAGGGAWVVLWKGDRRKGLEPLVVMPLSLYDQLMEGAKPWRLSTPGSGAPSADRPES